MVITKSIAGGKMVSDYDLASVPNNCYLKARNIRNGKVKGAVGNCVGVTKSPVSLHSPNSKVLGTAVDIQDNKIYSVVFEQDGFHSIVELDVETSESAVVVENLTDTNGVDVLKCALDKPITSARIIDGGDVNSKGVKTSKVLIYTDNNTDIRYINISKIRRYKATGNINITISNGKNVINGSGIKPDDLARYVRLPGGVWREVESISALGVVTLKDALITPGTYGEIQYTYRDSISYKETLLAKAPPLFPIKAEYFTDGSVLVNNLRGELFQFVYQYIYDDNEASVYSITSEIPIPTSDNGINDTLIDNAIKLTLNTGDRGVKKIKIGFRKLISSPNDYFEAFVLDKKKLGLANNVDFEYNFFNNSNIRSIPFADINNLDFDRVPFTAGCLALLNNGSLVMGDVTDGWDLEPTDMVLSIGATSNFDASKSTVKCSSRYRLGIVYGDDLGRRTPVLSDDSNIVKTLDFNTLAGGGQYIQWEIKHKPPVWATWYAVVMTKNLTHKTSYYGIASKLEIKLNEPDVIYAYIENLNNLTKTFGSGYVHYEFAKGDRFKWLKKSDESIFPGNIECEILADTFVKVGEGDAAVDKRVLKIRKPINFPSTYFTNNGIGGKDSGLVVFEAYAPKLDSELDNVFYHTGQVFKVLNPGTEDRMHDGGTQAQTSLLPAKGEIRSGDCFIRERSIPKTENDIPSADGVTTIIAKSNEQYIPETSRETVLSFPKENGTDPANSFNGTDYIATGEKNIKVTLSYGLQIWDTYNGGDDPSVHIKIQKYSGGNWFDIKSHAYVCYNKSHTFTGQVQTVSTNLQNGERIRVIARLEPATKRIDAKFHNDSTITFVTTTKRTLVEDFNYTDFFKSTLLTLGTPTVIDSNFRKIRRRATLIHTDPYIPQTNVNGLNRVFPGYFYDYDLNNGAFMNLVNRGNYLIGIQQVDTVNIPVGMSIISSIGGGKQIGLSTELLNKSEPYRGGYGLGLNSTALVDTGTNVYLIDTNKGKFLRLGLDGYEDMGKIAEFSTWIFEKLKKYKASSNSIRLGFDSENDEIIISFGYIDNTADIETLGFNQENAGFTSFYDFAPEHMEFYGSKFFSFSNGSAYLHNSSVIRNEWYNDETYPSEIEVVFNEDYSVPKVHRGIRVHSTDKVTPVTFSTELGCETEIFEEDFELVGSEPGILVNKIDGVWFAPIPMDKNSDGGVIDGLPMRGKLLNMKVQFDNNNSQDLLAFELLSTNY